MEHSGMILNLSGQVSIKVVLVQKRDIESRGWHEYPLTPSFGGQFDPVTYGQDRRLFN